LDSFYPNRIHARGGAGLQACVEGERLLAGCGGGTALELLQIQPEGKKAMTAREFINGYRPAAGERLG